MAYDDDVFLGGRRTSDLLGTKDYPKTLGEAQAINRRRYPMGGRSSPPPPKQPTPMEEALAQIEVERFKAGEAEKTRLAEETRKKAEREAAIAKTSGDVTRLFGQGKTYGSSALADLGYPDTYGIMNKYTRALEAAKSGVPEVAENVGSYFNFGDLFNAAVGEAQTAQQGRLSGELSGAMPSGWETSKWADTADDAILASILNTQKTQASDALKSALARGQLSQGTYNIAAGDLGTKALAANAKLQDIGGGVLGKYRTELTDLGKSFSDQVKNYKLGQDVDVSDFTTNVGNRVGAQRGRLEGDIYTALGDTQLFDLDALIARSAGRAGPSNQALGGAPALPTGTQTEEEQKRTSGTTGVF